MPIPIARSALFRGRSKKKQPDPRAAERRVRKRRVKAILTRADTTLATARTSLRATVSDLRKMYFAGKGQAAAVRRLEASGRHERRRLNVLRKKLERMR